MVAVLVVSNSLRRGPGHQGARSPGDLAQGHRQGKGVMASVNGGEPPPKSTRWFDTGLQVAPRD